tara:strand:- start:2019 stop:2831 length:813 start_codon:yes stop_codon:yes gene_type:complete
VEVQVKTNKQNKIMHSKNFKTDQIKPTIKSNIAFTAGDLLFDWTAFEIPNGAAILQDISGYITGTNGSSQVGELFNLVFAKAIDGTPPPSLGTVNGGLAAASSVPSKNHIIGYQSIDFGERADAVLDSMVSYNMFGANFSSTTPYVHQPIVLQGDRAEGLANKGFQKIYVAGIAESNIDFGTGALANGNTVHPDNTITVDGTAATNVFAVGDAIYSATVAGGSIVDIGTITAVVDGTITVDYGDNSGITITNNHEICHTNPISIRFGLQY